MSDQIPELESLREEALFCIEQVAATLIWFSKCFCERGTIPRNTWRQLDRPLPRESISLRRAFELWQAIFRAERALRTSKPHLAHQLGDQAKKIREKLIEMLGKPHPLRDDLVVRLATDEIYGSLNPFSAATVLISEVFPFRSSVTPSYLAGHILFAELKLARRKAASYTADGIRERAPRIAAVAQGIYGLMLYVEHLRARALHFNGIAKQLDDVLHLDDSRKAIRGLPTEEAEKVEDAYVRISVTAIAPLSEQCDFLLLSTRKFFNDLTLQCQRLIQHDRLNTNVLNKAFLQSAKLLSDDGGIARKQKDGYEFARDYAICLYRTSRRIEDTLKAVFRADSYRSLTKMLNVLALAAARLSREHLGLAFHADSPPSICDSARYGFVEDLISTFSELPFRQWLRRWRESQANTVAARKTRPRSKGRVPFTKLTFLRESHPDLKNRLTYLCQRYDLEKPNTSPCRVVAAIGEAPIGRTVVNWWSSHSDSYYCSAKLKTPSERPSPTLDPPNVGTGGYTGLEWLPLRHRSFEATQRVIEELKQAQDLVGFKKALSNTALEYQNLADEVHDQLKRVAEWCQPQGRDLLLAAKTKSGPVDPNELVSALWVADRLGESWDELSEVEALIVIENLQEQNGSFPPVEPLCQNRGFLHYAPSAQTLSSLARFVIGAAPHNPLFRLRTQKRLKRWQKVLSAGTRFLSGSLLRAKGGLAGWQSDRHSEVDRIDCSVTTNAVMALCRSIDGYTSLLNIEATAGFAVSWPTGHVSEVSPTDCAAGKKQMLPDLMSIVRDLRQRTGRYTSLEGDLGFPLKAPRSLLFYGPPGTGKTYFQELIAGELGWPLIILTIGDFLADGEEKVGARTVQIFNQLRHVSNACIMFDEFDEMIIRRSHGTGRSGFDLLTPAMLPLLAMLRTHAETHNCLVTFTTNYIERLDRAAKRVGRVDSEIPLIYHDFTSRLLMFLKVNMVPTGEGKQPSWSKVEPILTTTGLCAFPEIRSYMSRNSFPPVRPDPKPRKALDLSFYLERLKESSHDTEIVKKEARSVVQSVGKDKEFLDIDGGTELMAKIGTPRGTVAA
jgi:hypothetical protein